MTVLCAHDKFVLAISYKILKDFAASWNSSKLRTPTVDAPQFIAGLAAHSAAIHSSPYISFSPCPVATATTVPSGFLLIIPA